MNIIEIIERDWRDATRKDADNSLQAALLRRHDEKTRRKSGRSMRAWDWTVVAILVAALLLFIILNVAGSTGSFRLRQNAAWIEGRYGVDGETAMRMAESGVAPAWEASL